MFEPLPEKPDSNAIELAVLERWESEGTFEQLRAPNRGGPKWSFVDGPVTANKKLAVHTAWGRTLKDVFQRYKAMKGFDQRYQNGFDCQGLWIEVGVERQLGFNSKREIEEFGLEEFAAPLPRGRRQVVRGADARLDPPRASGWTGADDYFTFSDTNIEYIWRFLKIVNERGWLYIGHRATAWCPRCGTSLSQHELTQSGVYQEKQRPVALRPLPAARPPRRVGRDLDDDAVDAAGERCGGREPRRASTACARTASGCSPSCFPNDTFVRRVKGSELVGLRYEGAVRQPRPRARASSTAIVPWDEVSLAEGTGIVHIATGAGPEDFELGRSLGLPVLTPVDEAGHFYDDYGWLHGLSTVRPPTRSSRTSPSAASSSASARTSTTTRTAGAATRRSSTASPTTGSSRSRAIREKLLEENAKVEWVPEYMGKRMDDWLRNMGDWNISRRRYYGLPLPFYVCDCGHRTVIGSKAELAERALEGPRPARGAAPALDRPRPDPLRSMRRAGRAGGRGRRRLARRRASSRSRRSAGRAPSGSTRATAPARPRASPRPTCPDNAYWEKWFPADWVTEMREQIRLWFYSQFFMSVVLVGRSPYNRVLGYEKMLDENGREMHGSWGNMIDAEDAFARMGADVMRWQYCAQPPDRNLLFGFGPGARDQAQAADLLELRRPSS